MNCRMQSNMCTQTTHRQNEIAHQYQTPIDCMWRSAPTRLHSNSKLDVKYTQSEMMNNIQGQNGTLSHKVTSYSSNKLTQNTKGLQIRTRCDTLHMNTVKNAQELTNYCFSCYTYSKWARNAAEELSAMLIASACIQGGLELRLFSTAYYRTSFLLSLKVAPQKLDCPPESAARKSLD